MEERLVSLDILLQIKNLLNKICRILDINKGLAPPMLGSHHWVSKGGNLCDTMFTPMFIPTLTQKMIQTKCRKM